LCFASKLKVATIAPPKVLCKEIIGKSGVYLNPALPPHR
jgi:hypothetical protein